MRADGAKLRAARERRFLTLRELAARAGVAYVTIWRMENNATGSARMGTIRSLAEALEIEPGELVDWEGGGEGKGSKKSRGLE